MKVLLDTHALLWWLTGSKRLSRKARSILSGENSLVVSAIALWEIAIKQGRGKMELGEFGNARGLYEATRGDDRVELLTITFPHVLGVEKLPNLHADPFDRLLISQSKYEKLPILTLDPMIEQYDVATIW